MNETSDDLLIRETALNQAIKSNQSDVVENRGKPDKVVEAAEKYYTFLKGAS